MALALLLACRKHTAPALLALAALAHISLPSVLIVPPLVMVLGSARAPVSALTNPSIGADPHTEDKKQAGKRGKSYAGANNDKGWKRVALMGLEWAAYVGVLAFAGNLAAGGWGWVRRSWGGVSDFHSCGVL